MFLDIQHLVYQFFIDCLSLSTFHQFSRDFTKVSRDVIIEIKALIPISMVHIWKTDKKYVYRQRK